MIYVLHDIPLFPLLRGLLFMMIGSKQRGFKIIAFIINENIDDKEEEKKKKKLD